jgi:hypothetical protein
MRLTLGETHTTRAFGHTLAESGIATRLNSVLSLSRERVRLSKKTPNRITLFTSLFHGGSLVTHLSREARRLGSMMYMTATKLDLGRSGCSVHKRERTSDSNHCSVHKRERTSDSSHCSVPRRERTKERVSCSVPTRERTEKRVTRSVPTRERTRERVSCSVPTRERTRERVPCSVPRRERTRERVSCSVPTREQTGKSSFWACINRKCC